MPPTKPALGYGSHASMRDADRPSPAVHITFPRALLAEIDAAAEARGVSRAAWLQEAAREKLAKDDAALDPTSDVE